MNMLHKLSISVIAIVALLCVQLILPAQAAVGVEGSQQLAALLNRFDSFSADFDQVSAGSETRRMEQAQGSLVMAKPNRFNWVAKEPFAQQLVSDGRFLWIYDPDLEQVTRRPLAAQQSGVPALILNGRIDELRAAYSIRLLHEEGDNQLFELLPLEEQSVFVRIRLLFSQQVIAELQLEDSLGQRTSVQFQNQRLNPPLAQGEFSFTPPQGVDVIIEDAGEMAN